MLSPIGRTRFQSLSVVLAKNSSKKGGRVLPMFRLEISDATEDEALISQNLACQVTDIVYEVEEFQSLVSVKQCCNYQCFGHSAKTGRSKQKCLICRESYSHKGCPNREARKPKRANCKGAACCILQRVSGIQKMRSGNMWSITKKHMPQLSAKTLSPSPKPQMRHLLSQPNSSLNL